MSTGDLNGNLQRLLRELKATKYPPDAVDEVGLRLGDPVALLPLLNFTLLKFSRHVARFIVRHGFELAGKTDQRFVESCFKLFRDVLNVRTVLTPALFFEQGYAERKVLLLCDVIAVCKKLHNEEVRQERLAALKATRQDQTGSRLAAPRRSSPQVKVVRNDDIEIQQVLAPQHLPNASDGAQSVYKTKRVVATARSPSPSPGVQPTAGKAAHRQQSSPNAALSASKEPSLELTFRPGVPANTVHVAQRQAPASSAAAAAPPIHTWFMNPAFADGDEPTADLGLGAGMGIGATGRPDSSAWWQLGPSSQEQQAAPSWPQAGAFQGAATTRPDAADGGGGAASGRHLFFSRPPVATSTTAAAPQGSSRQQQQPDRGLPHQPQYHQATTPPLRKAGAAGGAAAGGSGAGGVPGSSRALPSRDLDEWSFSNYFGPGKAAQRRRAGADDTDDSSQHAGDTDDGDAAGVHGNGGLVGEGDDLERDGPGSDQDHRRPVTHRATAGAPQSAVSSPIRERRPAAAAGASGATGGSSPVGSRISGGMGVDWQAQLTKLERETQQQMQQLKDKLASAEQELEKARLEARQSREALQAQVTVLEGRVRLLECELELCVKRAPGQSPSRANSPAQAGELIASPPARGALAADSSWAWSSPGRPRSADSAVQHRPRESSPQPDALPRAAGAAAPGYPDRGAMPDPAGARPSSAAAAPPRFAASGFAAQRTSQSPEAAPEPARESAGLRWDNRAAAASSAASGTPYSLHSSYGTVGGPAMQAGLSAPAPPTHEPTRLSSAMPAAVQPSSLPHSGGAGYRALPSFSPMPQPSFSFQPSSLMQQVASSAAHPQQHQPGHPAVDAGHPAAFGSANRPGPGPRLYGSSLDSAPTSARYVMAGPEASQGGLYPDSGSARTSGFVSSRLADGLRRPSYSGTADGAAAAMAASGADAGNVSDAPYAAWRGPERFAPRGGLPASILDRAAAATGAQEVAAGSGITVSQRQQQQGDGAFYLPGPHPVAGASSGQQQQHHYPAAPHLVENPAAVSQALIVPHQPGPGTSWDNGGSSGGLLHQVPPSSAGGLAPGGGSSVGSAAQGTGAAGGGGARNTDDLINSLYVRYTEAQGFLQTLRKH